MSQPRCLDAAPRTREWCRNVLVGGMETSSTMSTQRPVGVQLRMVVLFLAFPLLVVVLLYAGAYGGKKEIQPVAKVGQDRLDTRYPEPVVVEAKGKHSATVIFCHGLGGTGKAYASKFDNLSEGMAHVKFVFPNAPVQPITRSGGKLLRAWFDMVGKKDRREEPGQGNTTIEDSQKYLEALIRREVNVGIPTDRIVIAGISQGAALSLYTGVRLAEPVAAVVSLSGYIPRFNQTIVQNTRSKYLLCHGKADKMISPRMSQLVHQLLTSSGASAELKLYDGLQHTTNAQELKDVQSFFLQCLPPEPGSNST